MADLAPMGSSSTPSRSTARRLQWTAPFRDLVFVILVLAGIFDGLSGNPIHCLLLFGVAIALGREAVLGRGKQVLGAPASQPSTEDRSGRVSVWLVGALLVLTYALLIGSFGRYSWPATAAVLVPGAAALILSWQGPLRSRPEPQPLSPVGLVAWSSVFIGLGLWELTQLLLQPSLTTDSWAHPTISVITDPALATHPGRSLALAVWMGLGMFFLGR